MRAYEFRNSKTFDSDLAIYDHLSCTNCTYARRYNMTTLYVPVALKKDKMKTLLFS